MSAPAPDYLSTFLADVRRPPPELADTPPADPPEEVTAGYQRALQIVDAPEEAAGRQPVTVEEARSIIWDEMMAYAALPAPDHMLLIRAVPGIGKTTLAVRLAELLAGQGRRVLYAAPRHDFIHDLRAVATNPALIYEWLPRQEGDPQDPVDRPETCCHAEDINRWLHRGYEGMDFCSRICGWEYVNKSCPYHGQKRRREPIVMGQHQHVTSGHPLQFDFVIGDESPLGAFQHPWAIPARWILPPGMDNTEPLAEVLHTLRQLAEGDTFLSGPDLLAALGGAQAVAEACQAFSIPAAAVAYLPPLHSPGDSAKAPYFHLPQLVPLLLREARAAQADMEYPHRIIIAGDGHLLLLLRREVNDQLPRHVIWLDATGNERLYRAAFRRPVQVVDPPVRLRGKIIQVVDRANGKASLVQEGEATDRADQLLAQVRQIVQKHGLRRPGIVSFQDVVNLEGLTDLEELRRLHFYAARGTNVQQDVDGHIVAGTPQPSLLAMDRMARMLFFERMTPFNRTWSARPVAYNFVDEEGRGRAYPVGGFWHDPDLAAILWQCREAELIQAAHRSRLATRDVTVWLLTNLPVWELPPSELVQIRDLFDAPEGVNVFKWHEVVATAERICQQEGYVTAGHLVAALGIDKHTAYRYMEHLVETGEWEPAIVRAGRGRPPRAVRHRHDGGPVGRAGKQNTEGG